MKSNISHQIILSISSTFVLFLFVIKYLFCVYFILFSSWWSTTKNKACELWKSNNPRAINPSSGYRPIQSYFSFTLFSSQHIANATSILLFPLQKKTRKCLPVSSVSRSTCVTQWKYSRPWRPLPRPLTAWMAVVLISCHGDAQAGE